MDLLLSKDFREGVDSSFFKARSDTHCTSVNVNGLVIDDKSFNKFNNIPHLKREQTALDLSTTYNLPKTDGKEIVFETNISARQFFRNKDDTNSVPSIYMDRIRNIHEDPRLCCTAIYVLDELTQLSFMILITNQVIYALYGKDLEAIRSENIYENKEIVYERNGASFYSLIPIGRRGITNASSEMGPLDDYITVGLGFTSDNKVTWYLNKEPVHTISTLGYRCEDKYMVLNHGGQCQKANLSKLCFGYGHYSFLDFQLPNNYNRSMTNIDTSNGYRVERSSSGLVQLFPDDYYKEIYPSTYGSYVDMNIDKAFAISLSRSRTNASYILFGQGMVTFVRTLQVYIRDRYQSPKLPVVIYSHTPDKSSSITSSISSEQERGSSLCSTCGETLTDASS
jgi:hypothetical protein